MNFPTHFSPPSSSGSNLINMKDFIQQICKDLIKRFEYAAEDVRIKIEPIKLPAESGAFPLALLVNELVTHAFQHTFPAVEHPKLYVSLRVQNEKHLFLEVRDNGPRFIHLTDPRSLVSENLNKIQAFVKRQFQSDLIYEYKSGACFSIMIQNFPALDLQHKESKKGRHL